MPISSPLSWFLRDCVPWPLPPFPPPFLNFRKSCGMRPKLDQRLPRGQTNRSSGWDYYPGDRIWFARCILPDRERSVCHNEWKISSTRSGAALGCSNTTKAYNYSKRVLLSFTLASGFLKKYCALVKVWQFEIIFKNFQMWKNINLYFPDFLNLIFVSKMEKFDWLFRWNFPQNVDPKNFRNFSPTSTKILITSWVLNIFSKIQMLREAEKLSLRISTVIIHLYVLLTYMFWFGIHCSPLIFTYMFWYGTAKPPRKIHLYVLVLRVWDGFWGSVVEFRARSARNFIGTTNIPKIHLYVLLTYMFWFGVTAVHIHLYCLWTYKWIITV